MREIELSIVVPMHNCEKNISRCVNSLINQTFKNIEVILVDDYSEDNTLFVAQKFQNKDKRIKIIKKEANTGVSDSRNCGIKLATGKYITFVDADDYIELNAYEECLEIIEKEKIELLKFGYVKEFGEKLKKIRGFTTETNKKIEKKDFEDKIYTKVFDSRDYESIWNMIVKRECTEKIFFNNKLAYAEDFLYSVELLKNVNNIYFLDRCFYHYMVNDDSVTNKVNLKKILYRIDNILISYERAKEILEKSTGHRPYGYRKRVKKMLTDKMGLMAYYSNYKNYANLLSDMEKLDSYKNLGKEDKIKSGMIYYIILNVKIGIKEKAKKVLLKKR